MKSPLRRRALALVTGGALAVSTVVAVAPVATAAPDGYAYSAARWLDDLLVNGVATFDQPEYDVDWNFVGYSAQPSVGVTIDLWFTLNRIGARPAAQDRIIAGLADHADDYVTGFGFAPASAAKLASVVATAGADPAAYGGRDLVADVEGATDDDTGETADTWGGIGQAWATRALVLSGSDEAAVSLGFLLSKQCPNGSFPQVYPSACGTDVDADSTALAVATLRDAVDQGHAAAAASLARAGAALASAQLQDGSFVGNDQPNANSTGLAAVALAQTGHLGAAGSAAAWLRDRQVTAKVAEGTALTTELGAIAYDDAALTAGKADGITPEVTTQWVISTAQAAAGLQAQLPRASVTVTRANAPVAAGRAVAVTARGLAAGEKYTAAISGGATIRGTVPAGGAVTVSLKTPAGTAARTVTVTGARANRTGSATVQVLDGKKLAGTIAKKQVKRTKRQKVTVRGLTPREPVRVFYRGKLVKRGVANKNGTFVHRFRVGKKQGKATVIVRGAFNNRNLVRSFRVVK